MLLAFLAVAAIVAGITFVLADDRVGRISPRGPETGAVQARVMGLILLVAGGLTFLNWAY
jgi:threonine/homoserine/homoserine lactone efflux protein